MSNQGDMSRMRGLGRFVGHLWQAIGSSEEPGANKTEIGRRVEEAHTTAPDGRALVLRRTTIEEIEVHGDAFEPGSHDHPSAPTG